MTDAARHLEAARQAVARARSADTRRELEGDLEEALREVERALALDPGLSAAHWERGRVLRWLSRHEEAVDAFVEASSRLPGDAGLRLETATALAALGRHDAAVLEFDAARALGRSDADVLLGRARSLSALGRHEAAHTAWGEFLSLGDSRSVEVLGAPARLLGADVRRVEAEVERAWGAAQLGADAEWDALLEAHAPVLTGLTPPQAWVRALASLEPCRNALARWLGSRADAASWTRGVATWQRAGRHEEALDAARRLVSLAPTDSRAWFSLAEVHASRDERDAAVVAYERSLALEPDFLGAKARLAVVRGGGR